MLATIDVNDTKPLKDGIAFLDGQSTVVHIKGEAKPNLFKALLENKKPEPELTLEGLLPAFVPRIGTESAHVKFPGEVQFTVSATLTKDSASVGISRETKLKIGDKLLDVVVSGTLGFGSPSPPGKDVAEKGAADSAGGGAKKNTTTPASKQPTMSVAVTMVKNQLWQKAFDVDWLDIKDYKMSLELEASGDVNVALGGTSVFDGKEILLGGSMTIMAASSGLPTPKSIYFAVNDGKNKVGDWSLRGVGDINGDGTDDVVWQHNSGQVHYWADEKR